MSKIIIITAITLMLFGCDKRTDQVDQNYLLPDGLKDCKIFRLNSGSLLAELHVVRCPNSTTSTGWQTGGKDKTQLNVSTIEE